MNKTFKIVYIIFIMLFLLITGYVSCLYLKDINNVVITEENNNKEELINYLYDSINDSLITKEFLNYIALNYNVNTLDKLKDNLDNYDKNLWHLLTGNSYIVLNDLFNNKYDNVDNVKIIDKKGEKIISFVGDISLADNFYIMPKYDEREKGIYGILSSDVVRIMTESDIMVVNSEFTISDRGEEMPGKYYTFRASTKRIPIYNEMGVDLLTLANNHVYDFGEIAFNDMLDSLDEYNIPYIGAGRNIDEAMRPYYFIINGYKIAFVNATRAEKYILTPEATDTTGGVFRCYDPSMLRDLISDVKKESDFVVALIHFGKEDSHELEREQIDSSKIYIDAGADIVVGTHAHVLQGIEFYKNKPIIYNLGDFIFNDEDKDTGILQVKILNDGMMEYYFIPAHQKDEFTELLYNDDKIRVINDINSWSINALVDENGMIKEAN